MNEPRYLSAHLDTLPTVGGEPGPGEGAMKPVRHWFGLDAFGVNAFVGASVGDWVVPEHDEVSGSANSHEELYVVLRGRATFTVAGDTFDAPAGTLVAVRDPAAVRTAVAAEPDTAVLAIGSPAGQAFAQASWEARATEGIAPGA